ncbi:type ISP restriction/modification enzyme [Variovorax sp. OV329]|uniref:type ISP restriction/modification enzyme n=1 Tax=Variovorax sp. OV329 TaxID=1882825 RepID=UPI0008EFE3CF|nr:type ISP restriction/modification enzyme [Variovorax sp. OV329]SFN30452.1 hypothetical protein SAMN05444747_1215 [Variovorax sp. OV329]
MDFDKYLAAIDKALKLGNATEHTHRPALKELLEAAGKIVATNEPKRIDCGAPDYIITKSNAAATPIGYVEAKDVGKDLSAVEKDSQLKRYRASLRNLVLTDYLAFRLYRDGELIASAQLGKWNGATIIRIPEEFDAAKQLLQTFITSGLPVATSPRDLATRMAQMARLIRDLISKAFELENGHGDFNAQFEGFKRVLFGDELEPEQFADMYAQTICYGLFAARFNHEPGTPFTRQGAAYDLPKTNPFLRQLFASIAGAELDERIAWAVDDLADLLDHADISKVLKHFGKASKRRDPVVHFYETFLAEYDPALREQRGVYYTPEPVVGYIVRSVDRVLRDVFGLGQGLADYSKVEVERPTGKTNKKGVPLKEKVLTHRVQILDPAAGTGTFLFNVVDQIHHAFAGNEGMWPSYVAEHLLPRIYGFELLMAPYAVAHMKLGVQLRETGYDFASNERLRVFLTNTLEKAHELAGLPLFTQWLSAEASQASEVKQSTPIMVVVGNPPYSGHSVNKGAWIRELMDEYKKSPALLKPGQAKWLSDDYAKFIRFAQWRIDQTGHGVLAFVTNNRYLQNATFMDMRASLQKSFDDIFILDLKGSTKAQDVGENGTKDENVFDIQQGVSIAVMVKRPVRADKQTVRHFSITGSRQDKYEWLDAHDIADTPWALLDPIPPQRLFVPYDDTNVKEFHSYKSLPEIFNQNSKDPAPGIVTTHDQFAISWSADEAKAKVRALIATESEGKARELWRLCRTNQWSYAEAKKALSKDNSWEQNVRPIVYRPFDTRWTVYDSNVAVHRRERVSQHMLDGENIALGSTRAIDIAVGWEHAFVVDKLFTHHTVSLKEVNYLYPLYVYPLPEAQPSLGEKDTALEVKRRANLDPALVDELALGFGFEWLPEGGGDLAASFGPVNVFHYIYAVLFSPTYRDRYADPLKREHPRVPFTSDKKVFKSLCQLGEELVSLHTLKSDSDTGTISFPVAGTNLVEAVSFQLAESTEQANAAVDESAAADDLSFDKVGRVYINEGQFFDGVSQSVWSYRVGGYTVARKWLGDRVGRALTFEDLGTYKRILVALKRTMEIEVLVDAAIPAWPLA